jgi:hypothetical protein
MSKTISTMPKLAVHRRATPAVAALSLLVAACGSIVLETDNDRVRGSGEVTTETRSITEFERIVLAGEGSVLLEAGPDGQIEIETDDNLLTHLRTDVSGDTLTISTELGTDIDPMSGVTYRLGCPEITAVVLSGAGTIDLASCATQGRLDMELPGAGTILAPDLDASTVRASLPGAGSIVATGRVDLLEVVLAGAGEFDGRDLRAGDASVDSTGVGMTTVWATDELFVSLTGVGSVGYYGEPQVSSSVTGVGTIEALGPK